MGYGHSEREQTAKLMPQIILLEQLFTELNYTIHAITPIMNRKAAISPETMNAMIESSAIATADILREVEDNFITSTKGHITYHEYLMKSAEQNGSTHLYLHHRVMMETYETMLRNYEASRRYGSV